MMTAWENSIVVYQQYYITYMLCNYYMYQQYISTDLYILTYVLTYYMCQQYSIA